MLVLILTTLALASSQPAPTTVITDEGKVVGKAVLAVQPDTLLSKMDDLGFVARISKSDTQVTVREREGACVVADYVSPSVLMKVTYKLKVCRVSDGFDATMLESNAFVDYHTRWTIQPHEAGSAVTYLFEAHGKAWVPDGLLRRATRNKVQEMLVTLQEHFSVTP